MNPCPVCLCARGAAAGAGEPAADTMKMSPLDVGPLGRPLNLDTSTSTDASNLLIVAKLRRSLDASRASAAAAGAALPGDGALTVLRGHSVTASVCGIGSSFRRLGGYLWV